MTVRILAAALMVLAGLGYIALAVADRDAAIASMPVMIGLMVLAIGIDGITRHGRR